MKRRCLALFLSLVMVFSFTAPAYAEGTAVDGNIVIESTEPTIISEPDGNGDGFNAYEFDDVYDVGGDTEVITCADCGNEPCTCEKEPASVCETCGSEPCTCEPVADPQLCEVCNAEPCTCEEATVCETCGQEPCLCETEEPVACEVCSQIPCICEQEQPGVSDPVCPGDDTCTIEGCQNHNPPTPTACEECGVTDGHAEECSQFVDILPQVTFYQKLMAAETLQAMYETLLDGMDAADELTADDMTAMEARADVLYTAIDEPTADDDEYYELLVDMFAYIRGEYELNGAEILAGTDFQTAFNAAEGGNDSKVMSGEYVLNGTVEIDRIIDIPDGKTLTITGGGTLKATGHIKDNGYQMFYVRPNATLIIGERDGSSTDKDQIILSGDDINASRPCILVDGGTVELNHTTIEKWNNTKDVSTHEYDHNGGAIGIHVKEDVGGSAGLYSCEIKNNTSSQHGGAIYSEGNLTITNSYIHDNCSNYGGAVCITQAVGSDDVPECSVTGSTIKDNWAYTQGGAVYGVSSVLEINASELTENRAIRKPDNAGIAAAGSGGGAIHITGKNGQCTVDQGSEISRNFAGAYGGGIQVSEGAKLTLISGKINHNTSYNRGGGALHITANATFDMQGGELAYNTAYEIGGAIHTSYTCSLNLTGGEIKGNTVYGRGGGIHVDMGGNLVVDGTDITGNSAYKDVTLNGVKYENIGISNVVGGVQMDDQGNVLYPIFDQSRVEGNKKYGEAGYGGGVLIDCGTLTLKSGAISGNHADNGGGGVAFVMLIIGNGEKFGQTNVSALNMEGGSISDNTTHGNGGGVYLMTNMLDPANVAAMNGWDYRNGVFYIKGSDTLATITNANNQQLAAADFEAIFNAIPEINITGGSISDNTADGNGGGAYQEENSRFFIGGDGEIKANSAIMGGGVYIAQGTATISGGTMSGNTAEKNGGALYISGDVTMTDGTIGGEDKVDANSATNGGAVYITEGNMYIKHGILNGNKATDGGAVYMDGDADTTLRFESGQMNNNYAADDGGAIYATGGTVYIGLENCPGQTRNNENEVIAENNDAHKQLDHEGICQYHPQIQGNEAEDVGGGIALAGKDASSGDLTGGGKVHFYCGVANTNKALYKGVGLNVFMQGGEFHYYEGTNIGEPHDPDLVIIGGKLENHDDSTEYVYLHYYQNNTDNQDRPDFIGMAKLDSYMNLPEGEYFWEAAANEVFVGWTPFLKDAPEGQKAVRDKDDYKPSGTSVQISDTEEMKSQQNTYDGTEDTIMNLYAVWAPETNNITYVDSLTNAESSTTPSDGTAQYTLKKGSSQTITIPATNSAAHPGFAIVGWYLYQDEGQNANWCNADCEAYEPAYTGNTLTPYSNLIYDKAFGEGGMMYYPLSAPNADLVLTVDPMTFGNITLVAKYELQYSDLTITKQGAQSIDENQAFLFNLIGSASAKSDQTIKNADALEMISALEDLDMQVVIEGDGSIVIKHLPLGTYTVTENGKWSWRYGETSSNPANGQVTLGLNDPKTVTFTNTRTKSWWLSGDWYTENWWGEKSIRREDEYIDPTKVKTN